MIDSVTAKPLPEHDVMWQKDAPYIFGDFTIVIEFLQGDTRTKVSNTGVVVTSVMPAAYGYIMRTTDIHGEEIDMYLAPMPDNAASVYVIDQINPATGQFDEHKVMFGFSTPDEVIHTYCSVFGDGSGEKRLAALTTFTMASFGEWLGCDGASLRPASDYHAKTVTTTPLLPIIPPKLSHHQPAQRDAAGGVMIPLPDLSQGPRIETKAPSGPGFHYHVYMYSALDTTTWSNAVDTVCRILDLGTSNDVMHIHIACRGGSVFLMGRMQSAIAATDVKVITYAEGQVASAATTIWAAGHERHILPAAFFMQHMSSQLLTGKTTDIKSQSVYGVAYIEKQLQPLVTMGLFTASEVDDMVDKSADIFISGREAIRRVGEISTGRQQIRPVKGV